MLFLVESEASKLRVLSWNKSAAFYGRESGAEDKVGIEMGKVHEVWETKQEPRWGLH